MHPTKNIRTTPWNLKPEAACERQKDFLSLWIKHSEIKMAYTFSVTVALCVCVYLVQPQR